MWTRFQVYRSRSRQLQPPATDDDGSCTFTADCPGDFDANGIISVNDVLVALGELDAQEPVQLT